MIRPQSDWRTHLSTRDPLVTIIVPCFNKAEYIGESIRAAVMQTYPYIELIVVNDGSTDSSLSIIDATLRLHTPFKAHVLNKPNSGISDTRNYAITRASGDLIMTLDGDDLVDPTFLAKAIQMMRTTGCNLVTTDLELFGAETGSWEPPRYEPHALRYNNCIPTLVVYDRNLWEAVGGYSCALPFNEDWDFFIRCSAQELRAQKIEEKLFKYRVTHDGLAHNFIKETWKWSVSLMVTGNPELYPVTEVLWAHEQLGGMPSRWVERLTSQLRLFPDEARLYLWLAIAAEGKGDVDQAVAYLQRIADHTPYRWQACLRLGVLLAGDNSQTSLNYFHHARILRPDLSPLVEKKIATTTHTAHSASRENA
jgi:glycosyltransferase involved in cell wall biosynthesis